MHDRVAACKGWLLVGASPMLMRVVATLAKSVGELGVRFAGGAYSHVSHALRERGYVLRVVNRVAGGKSTR